MTKVQMEEIADRAARLAVSKMDEEEAQVYAAMELTPYRQYYEEYLDQLRTGDTECSASGLDGKSKIRSVRRLRFSRCGFVQNCPDKPWARGFK